MEAPASSWGFGRQAESVINLRIIHRLHKWEQQVKICVIYVICR